MNEEKKKKILVGVGEWYQRYSLCTLHIGHDGPMKNNIGYENNVFRTGV